MKNEDLKARIDEMLARGIRTLEYYFGCLVNMHDPLAAEIVHEESSDISKK